MQYEHRRRNNEVSTAVAVCAIDVDTYRVRLTDEHPDALPSLCRDVN